MALYLCNFRIGTKCNWIHAAVFGIFSLLLFIFIELFWRESDLNHLWSIPYDPPCAGRIELYPISSKFTALQMECTPASLKILDLNSGQVENTMVNKVGTSLAIPVSKNDAPCLIEWSKNDFVATGAECKAENRLRAPVLSTDYRNAKWYVSGRRVFTVHHKKLISVGSGKMNILDLPIEVDNRPAILDAKTAYFGCGNIQGYGVVGRKTLCSVDLEKSLFRIVSPNPIASIANASDGRSIFIAEQNGDLKAINSNGVIWGKKMSSRGIDVIEVRSLGEFVVAAVSIRGQGRELWVYSLSGGEKILSIPHEGPFELGEGYLVYSEKEASQFSVRIFKDVQTTFTQELHFWQSIWGMGILGRLVVIKNNDRLAAYRIP